MTKPTTILQLELELLNRREESAQVPGVIAAVAYDMYAKAVVAVGLVMSEDDDEPVVAHGTPVTHVDHVDDEPKRELPEPDIDDGAGHAEWITLSGVDVLSDITDPDVKNIISLRTETGEVRLMPIRARELAEALLAAAKLGADR